ncbi:MAG: hypothetical protein WA960_21175 [Tunicatimonas sp.]
MNKQNRPGKTLGLFFFSFCEAVKLVILSIEMNTNFIDKQIGRAFSLSVVWVVTGAVVFAQNEKTLEVEVGTEVMYLMPEEERYRYNHFQRGKVHFKDGSAVSANLNYNFLNQEVEFINTTRDTLSILRKYALDSIQVGEHSFYYHPTEGYMEVEGKFSPVKLAVHRFVYVVQNKEGRVIFHNLADNSHDPMSALGNDQRKLTLLSGQKHFIVDKNHRFYPAQRSSLYRVFPQHKTAIRSYLKKYRIDLKREEDIIKVLQFCNQMISY